MKDNEIKCKTPVWILTNQRSGSTFLAKLLNSTEVFPSNFTEHFHEHQIRSGTYKNSLPQNAKILKTHFKNVHGKINKRDIKNIYPNIKFILLRRRDLIAHTISQYFHKSLNISFIKKNQPRKFKKYEKAEIPFNKEVLLNIYKETLNFWNNWNYFLKGENYISIVYENFVKDPYVAVKRIFNFLEMDLPSNWQPEDHILKLENPLKDKYKKRLENIIKKENI